MECDKSLTELNKAAEQVVLGVTKDNDEFEGDGGLKCKWTRIRRSLLAMLKWCVRMVDAGETDNENDEVDDEVSFVYPKG